MELREILAAVRHGWWMLVLGVLVGVGLAAVVTLLQVPRYTSTAQVFVSTTGATSASDALSGSQFSQERVTSYSRLLVGEELSRRVIDRLDLPYRAEDLVDDIGASVSPDTVLIDVSVSDPSAERAQAIAEALITEFKQLVERLEPSTQGGVSPIQVTVTDRPQVPTDPSSPRPVVNVALGLVLGLAIGLAAAVARARLDRSVKDPETAAEVGGAPSLGVIPRDPALEAGVIPQHSREGAASESFRRLCTNLQFVDVDDPPKVIMVSSAIPGEGKTTLAVNLAVALSDMGRSVALVESDLRRPRVTRYMGLVGGVGLSNVLVGSAALDDVLQRHGTGVLDVLGAGPQPPNPGQLLASAQMSALVRELAATHEFVILDAPPILPVADATGMAVLADGVLLAVRYGHTRRDLVQQASAGVVRAGARVLGVVMTVVPPRSEAGAAYGYRSYSAEER